MTIGAAFVLATALTAVTNQYGKTYTLARDKARLEQHRRELIADNARLREEIDRLQNDDRYIEQIARQQLGLVRPGEVELLVVPYDGTVSPPGRAPRGAPARTSATDGSGGDPSRPVGLDHGRPQTDIRETGRGAGTPSGADAAGPRPRRGIAAWVIGVRDAVLRLFHRAQH